MNHRFKVLFILKRRRLCDEKSLPIYVRVKVDGTVAEWSVKKRVENGMK